MLTIASTSFQLNRRRGYEAVQWMPSIRSPHLVSRLIVCTSSTLCYHLLLAHDSNSLVIPFGLEGIEEQGSDRNFHFCIILWGHLRLWSMRGQILESNKNNTVCPIVQRHGELVILTVRVSSIHRKKQQAEVSAPHYAETRTT